jgi:hypothetical protein
VAIAGPIGEIDGGMTATGAGTAAAQGGAGRRRDALRVTSLERIGVLLGRATGLVATLVCVACAVWATYFAIYGLVPVLVLLMLAGQPFAFRGRLTWKRRVVACIVAIVLGVLLAGPILHATQRASDALTAQLRRSGPGSLGPIEVSGLCALWTFVGLVTMPIAPEFSIEHFLMAIPSEGVRTVNSDFPMKAHAVEARVRAMAQRLGARTEAVFPAERISFDYARDPLRVALALNPVRVSAVTRLREGRRVLEVEGRVEARYPESSPTRLPAVAGVEFVLEEGLFWALQERGLLHPYTVSYRWTVDVDDLLRTRASAARPAG